MCEELLNLDTGLLVFLVFYKQTSVLHMIFVSNNSIRCFKLFISSLAESRGGCLSLFQLHVGEGRLNPWTSHQFVAEHSLYLAQK